MKALKVESWDKYLKFIEDYIIIFILSEKYDRIENFSTQEVPIEIY